MDNNSIGSVRDGNSRIQESSIQESSIQESGSVESRSCTPPKKMDRVSTAATKAPLSFLDTIRSISNAFLSAATKGCSLVVAGLFKTVKMLNPFSHFSTSGKNSSDRKAGDETASPADVPTFEEAPEMEDCFYPGYIDTYGADVCDFNQFEWKLYWDLSDAGRKLYADLQPKTEDLLTLSPVQIEKLQKKYDGLTRRDVEVVMTLHADRFSGVSSRATIKDPLNLFDSLSSFDGTRYTKLRLLNLANCPLLRHVTNIGTVQMLTLTNCPLLEAKEAKEAILKMDSLIHVFLKNTPLDDPDNPDCLTADDIHQIFCNNRNMHFVRFSEYPSSEEDKLIAESRACRILGTKKVGEAIIRETADGIFAYGVCEGGAIMRKDLTEEQKPTATATTPEGSKTEAETRSPMTSEQADLE